jgi:hypothetical protein
VSPADRAAVTLSADELQLHLNAFARLMPAIYSGPAKPLSAVSAASFQIADKDRFYLIGLGYWKDYRMGLIL